MELKGSDITPDTRRLVLAMEADFESQPTNRVMQNAVTQVSVESLAKQRRIVTEADHSFSIKLDDWKVTWQKMSGRCWLFAGLNLIRVGAMKKMKVEDFEFSQNWPLFWNKLERANYFLQSMIALADRDVGDRTISYLLAHPNDDGGQWNMFVNIVKKYGLVPKSAMPVRFALQSTACREKSSRAA